MLVIICYTGRHVDSELDYFTLLHIHRPDRPGHRHPPRRERDACHGQSIVTFRVLGPSNS
jgi:hypothetical protein